MNRLSLFNKNPNSFYLEILCNWCNLNSHHVVYLVVLWDHKSKICLSDSESNINIITDRLRPWVCDKTRSRWSRADNSLSLPFYKHHRVGLRCHQHPTCISTHGRQFGQNTRDFRLYRLWKKRETVLLDIKSCTSHLKYKLISK